MALVPYSQSVNVGSYADAIRGAMQGSVNVSGISWATGTAKSITAESWLTGSQLGISGITKASNAVVTTSSSHGYNTGDTVYITGVQGMTQVNGKSYVITKVTNTTFRLNVSSSGWNTYTTSSSDFAQKCEYANCEIKLTASNHGFLDGDTVWVKASTTGGMASLNAQAFVVANRTTNTFTLAGTNGIGTSYTAGGTAQKCQVSTCEMVVTVSTAPTRVLQTGDKVRITGVGGLTAINNCTTAGCSTPPPVWAATAISTTKLLVSAANLGAWTSATYSSGGTVQCAMYGCTMQWVDRQSGSDTWFYPTNCVTERVGAQSYTEAGPDEAFVGANYRLSGSPCIAQTIVPLTDVKATLHATANGMVAGGSTGGHIGIAWAWYMLSPEFAYLWPEANRPEAYATSLDDAIKVVIIMTDGAYNTVYRNGVVAKNSINGSGGSDEHINLDSINGSSLTQGAAYCAAMKQDADPNDSYDSDRVIVYTVGFDIANDANAQTLLNGCATDADHAYLASDGDALLAAFQDIANNISQLRVTK